MTDEEIERRIAQGEDSRTQFKCGPIGVAKLAAELAAFSNAAGGVILFGVGDGGEVIGLEAAAKKLLNDELSNAANDNVRPSVYPQTEYHTLDGKQILCVTVAEGVSKPYADKSGNYWMKSDDELNLFTVIVKRNKEHETVNEVVNSSGETVNSENGGVNDIAGGVNGGVNVEDGPVNVPINEGHVLVNDRNVPVNVPVNGENVPVSEIDGPVNMSDGPVNSGSGPVKLLDMICKFPGKNKNVLSEMTGISLRSVKRFLEEDLKGKVEFRGAPKNGGYYIIESTEKEGR